MGGLDHISSGGIICTDFIIFLFFRLFFMFLSFLLGTTLLFFWFLAYLQVFLVMYRSGNDGTANPPPFTIREFSVLNRLKN